MYIPPTKFEVKFVTRITPSTNAKTANCNKMKNANFHKHHDKNRSKVREVNSHPLTFDGLLLILVYWLALSV